MSVTDEAAEFHAGHEIIPFFQNEFVLYRLREWRDTIVIGVIEIVGDEIGGF